MVCSPFPIISVGTFLPEYKQDQVFAVEEALEKHEYLFSEKNQERN